MITVSYKELAQIDTATLRRAVTKFVAKNDNGRNYADLATEEYQSACFTIFSLEEYLFKMPPKPVGQSVPPNIKFFAYPWTKEKDGSLRFSAASFIWLPEISVACTDFGAISAKYTRR